MIRPQQIALVTFAHTKGIRCEPRHLGQGRWVARINADQEFLAYDKAKAYVVKLWRCKADRQAKRHPFGA